MAVLVDTCVIVYAFNPQAAEHVVVRAAIQNLVATGEDLVITPQVVAEYWNVGSRPKSANGRGLAVEQLRRMVDIICRIGKIAYESQSGFATWRELIERHQVRGVAVHDARIAAAAIELGARGILTCNERDFRRYEVDGLRVLRPESIVQSNP
jgi:predicted nucleic acid-binding protein